MTQIHVYADEPDGFSPQVEVAACYCFHQDRFLILQRHPSKPQGGTWGVPCGKLMPDETPRQAVIREIQEEVGLKLSHPEYLGKLYMVLGDLSYIYHMFKEDVSQQIDLNLEEHTSYRWVTFSEAYRLPLIAGGKEALDAFIIKLR